MVNIVLPTSGALHNGYGCLPFYLGLEEWVARTLPPGEYLFTWRVTPTVIVGRNQCTAMEVNLDYCHDHGINVCRRRSGGGCVYADFNNLMISYIAPQSQIEGTFSSYTSALVRVLAKIGVDARATGRNDIMVGDAKVSGNAFYRLALPSGEVRSIVHGTLLYDVDAATMRSAITPSRSKLASKQVRSVESRVAGLKTFVPRLTLDDIERHIISGLTDTEYILTPDDVKSVDAYACRYTSQQWILGRHNSVRHSGEQLRRKERIEGVGEMLMIADMVDGCLADIDLTGDFFIMADIDDLLLGRLRGCPPTGEALTQALVDTDVSKIIRGLSTERLIQYIAGSDGS